jgi:hypothetical protein
VLLVLFFKKNMCAGCCSHDGNQCFLWLGEESEGLDLVAFFGGNALEISDLGGFDGNKEAAAGLWVGEDVALAGGATGDFVAVAVEVAQGASGYAFVVEVKVEDFAGDEGYLVEVDDGAGVAGLAHFGEVAEEAEAGDIGHGLDVGELAESLACAVELFHAVGGDVGVRGLEEFFFLGGGEDAYAEGFGEEELCAGGGAAVFLEVFDV